MKGMKRKMISQFASNVTNYLGTVSALAGHGTGIPVHENYPPSYVIVPSLRPPRIRIMRGEKYLNMRKRGLI